MAKKILEREEIVLMRHKENALVAIVEVADTPTEKASFKGEVHEGALHAAALLKSQLRKSDVVARVGINCFAMLIRQVSEAQQQHLFEKIQQGFREADIAVTVGGAMRLPCGSLPEAARIADIRMYNEKLRTK